MAAPPLAHSGPGKVLHHWLLKIQCASSPFGAQPAQIAASDADHARAFIPVETSTAMIPERMSTARYSTVTATIRAGSDQAHSPEEDLHRNCMEWVHRALGVTLSFAGWSMCQTVANGQGETPESSGDGNESLATLTSRAPSSIFPGWSGIGRRVEVTYRAGKSRPKRLAECLCCRR